MEVKTLKINNLEALRKELSQELLQQPITDKYVSWRYKNSQISVVAYTSGKVVFSGNADIDKYLAKWGLIECNNMFSAKDAVQIKEKNVEINFGKKNENLTELQDGSFIDIGSDEAGKGEYWGPLCVCAVFLDSKSAKKLEKIGVKDSKKLSDEQVQKLALQIKKLVKYQLIVLPLHDFNNQIKVKKNISILLGDLHAQAINNLIEQLNQGEISYTNSDPYKVKKILDIVVDKFSSVSNRIDGKLISYTPGGISAPGKSSKNIKQKDCNIRLHQIEKGEQYLAVACASIIARQAYLKNLKELSEKYDFIFPKGYMNIEKMIQSFVEVNGRDALYDVAKTSFKTTQKALPDFKQ